MIFLLLVIMVCGFASGYFFALLTISNKTDPKVIKGYPTNYIPKNKKETK